LAILTACAALQKQKGLVQQGLNSIKMIIRLSSQHMIKEETKE